MNWTSQSQLCLLHWPTADTCEWLHQFVLKWFVVILISHQKDLVTVFLIHNNLNTTICRTPSTLENFYLMCEPQLKLSILVSLLKERSDQKLMVFAATCACVDYMAVLLKHFLTKTQIFSIHGKMKNKRHKIFNQFRNSKSGILLCTDVMARGVDIPDVDW